MHSTSGHVTHRPLHRADADPGCAPAALNRAAGRSELQQRIAINLAADVADDPAKPCPQELELPPNAFELESELERLHARTLLSRRELLREFA
jgi:hypothetical protein